MITLCTIEQVRAAERAAVRAGRSEQDLMIAAGRGVAALIAEAASGRTGTVVFLVGPGNNGGDGLAAAGALVEAGWTCRVWSYGRDGLSGAPVPGASASQLEWVSDDALPRACLDADAIVDAVFGIGGRTELPAAVRDAFAAAWAARVERGATLVALDIPSGVDADTGEAGDHAFRADMTVMVGLPKLGLYRAPAMRHTGIMHLVDIGLEAAAAGSGVPQLIAAADARAWLPRRRADTHKRAVGALLIVGGAPNYYGAPRMAAASAYRAGAGLVTLAVPRSVIAPTATALPEATYLPLPEGEFGGAGVRMAKLVRDALGSYRALLLGPGLGSDPPVDEFLSAFFGLRAGGGHGIGFGSTRAPELEGYSGRAVIDADGLNWLATRPDWPERLRTSQLVLTPHPGELSRLLDVPVAEIVADPWRAASGAASRFGQVVVLKQGHSVVAEPEGGLLVAPQVLPSLATAGTGDVLAGIIAGLMAQGLGPWEAAATGLYVGTAAALRATAKTGTLGLVASDLIDAIPRALRELYDARWLGGEVYGD